MMGATILVIALNAIGCLAVYLILSARLRRAASPDTEIRRIREEVDRLVIELNQTTDRNLSLIEDKLSELSDLLAKADRKIGLVRRESEKHDVGNRVYARILESKSRPEAPVRTAPAPEQAGTATVQAGTARAQAESARAQPGTGMAPAAPAGVVVRDFCEEVLALHRAGVSAPLISSKVGAPLGEVELVISLEKRKASK
jgi:hypothetical protein